MISSINFIIDLIWEKTTLLWLDTGAPVSVKKVKRYYCI